MVERLYVAIKYFMSRQSVTKWRVFLLRQSSAMSRHSWPGWEEFLSRLSILCHDRDWPRKEILYRDRAFFVATERAAG